mgnify:CR=1 FL=1
MLRHKKMCVVLSILTVLVLSGILVWLHGPVIPAEKGPFLTEQQVRQLAEKQIASTVANPPFAGLEWTKDSKVTYMQPHYDFAGNAIAYECRVETNGQKGGDIFITTQGKGRVSGFRTTGQATCDQRMQTALGRDAQNGDYLINGAVCGYDVAVRQADGTYLVAQMFGKPKVISERELRWHAWWSHHNPLRNDFA